MNDEWRDRLRVAIDRTNKKHSWIAEQAGIAPGTLSRILTGKLRHPSFEVVMRIAHVCGETVGWVAGEPVYVFSVEDRRRLASVVAILGRAFRDDDQR